MNDPNPTENDSSRSSGPREVSPERQPDASRTRGQGAEAAQAQEPRLRQEAPDLRRLQAQVAPPAQSSTCSERVPKGPRGPTFSAENQKDTEVPRLQISEGDHFKGCSKSQTRRRDAKTSDL